MILFQRPFSKGVLAIQKENNIKPENPREFNEVDWATKLGFWSAFASTLLGIAYFMAIGVTIITGNFTFPPPDSVQLFAGILSLVVCVPLVVLMASLHAKTPGNKKIFSLISLSFTLLFAISVSINRFTQLGIVRQAVSSGNTSGIDWFLPYGNHSVMFGLEIMGWGWFLGLAMLFAAPLFSGGRLEKWLRWLLVSYGILGITSAVGQLLSSLLVDVGFIAWGVILFVITGLLMVYFKRLKNQSDQLP